MRNARLDELQAGIKIGRRNINNLRYADDTTLRTEIEEEMCHYFHLFPFYLPYSNPAGCHDLSFFNIES